jgi:diguanylate cyclase (GGDEF)-like protein
VRAHLGLVAGLAAIAIAAVTASSYAWGAGIARSDAKAELRDQARRVAKTVTSDLGTAGATAAALAAQPTIAAAFAGVEPCSLSSEGTGDFPVVRFDIVRADGAVGCSSDTSLVGLDRRPHAGSGWLAPALQRQKAQFFDAYDAPSGARAVVMTERIGPAGHPLGVVAVVAPLAGVGSRLATTYAGVGQESFTIVDSETRALLTSSERGTKASPSAWPATGDATGLDGEERLYASAPVEGSTWLLYSGRRASVVLADARRVLLRQSGVGLAVLLVLVVAVVVLDRRVVAPLRTLRGAVVEAGRSAESEPVPAKGASELVGLAEEFNAMRDVRAANEAQLEHMISHDALTGLPNRVGLRAVLEEHLAQGHPAAVISLGLDRFRILNESLGHDVADRILAEVAARLSRALAPQDVLARFRGDEFIAFCPGIATEQAAVEAARMLEGELREPIVGEGYDVAVTGTAGVAVVVRSRPSAAQLLREADLAMHHAKRNGLAVAVYEQQQGVQAREHLEIERALRVAMERGELLLHYQPILDIASGRIVGSEALVRWAHPERGLLLPAAFLPVAERSGQIVELGGIALHLACRQVARWDARQLRVPVSVNVAVEQLRGGDLPALVETELAESGIDADLLCLELTESSFLQNVSSDLDQLAALRGLGVHLAIDDFGTGYSSLAYVQNLPVDRLKIDISFVHRIARDPRARHLVTAIMGMAQALSLEVIAEGVEEIEQLETLELLGCQRAQGFLIGRPMAAGDFAEVLQSRIRVAAERQSA